MANGIGKSRISIAAILLLIAYALGPSESVAAAPTCQTHNGAPYCSYVGKVAQVYVNYTGRILMYFDTPLDLAAPSSVGIEGVTKTIATTLVISSNPDFAEFFYSAILSAQARGADVVIQMRAVDAGYLVVDRIWVK